MLQTCQDKKNANGLGTPLNVVRKGLSLAVFCITLNHIFEVGMDFMRVYACLFTIVLVRVIGSAASAQEPKGWVGADMLDVTKAEADKLGWDTPHGAKLGVVGITSREC